MEPEVLADLKSTTISLERHSPCILWMIKDSCNLLWHTVWLLVIRFQWKSRFKATFHEEPSPLGLGELGLFMQELALLVKSKSVFSIKMLNPCLLGHKL
jgi:hypothetical protein